MTASGTKQLLERKEKMGYRFLLATLPTILLEKNIFWLLLKKLICIADRGSDREPVCISAFNIKMETFEKGNINSGNWFVPDRNISCCVLQAGDIRIKWRLKVEIIRRRAIVRSTCMLADKLSQTFYITRFNYVVLCGICHEWFNSFRMTAVFAIFPECLFRLPEVQEYREWRHRFAANVG